MMDQATSVRSGEALDVASLTTYLQQHFGPSVGSVRIQQFPSGYSNLTYLVSTSSQEYVLRRPPMGQYAPQAHDMEREYRVLSLLKPVYDAVPTPVLYCEATNIIGAPFYLMERVPGVILRGSASGEKVSPAQMQALSERAVDHLVQLHALDTETTGLSELGHPVGYVSRQVDGWIKRYRRAETDSIPAMSEVMEWLPEHLPPELPRPALIHNDYKYDNLVLNPDNLAEIIAVLDWEMATVGDPLMDLGTTLGYWAEADDHPALRPFNLTWREGNLNREAVAQRYAERSGYDLDHLVFYYVFGCFKIGVIAQQIYARYQQGHTRDERFAGLIHVVKACAQNAQRALTLNRISNLNR